MCSWGDDPSMHDRVVSAEPVHIVASGISEVWCQFCPATATAMVRDRDGSTVSLCATHFAMGECDDCGQWVGHRDDIEH